MPQLGAVEDVDGPQPRTGNHGKQKYGFEYNTAEMVVANSVAFNNPWQSTAPKIIGKEKGAVAKLNFLPDSSSANESKQVVLNQQYCRHSWTRYHLQTCSTGGRLARQLVALYP